MAVLSLPELAITPNTIHHMDFFALCNALADKSVHMILCDLPYGTTACNWDTVIPFDPLWAQFKRVIKPNGAIVLMATEPFASHLRMSNFEYYRYDWVWVNKARPTMFIHAKNRPLNVYELVLVFSQYGIQHKSITDKRLVYYPQKTIGTSYTKTSNRNNMKTIVGNRPSHDKFQYTKTVTTERYPTNVIEINESNNLLIHPTQKPLRLFEYLIKTYTLPGDLIFDPCVGSGTTAAAARNTGRSYICGDATHEYVEMARKRIVDSDPFVATVHDNGIKQLSLFE